MNRIDEFDALKNADWSGVYRDVPQSVNEGVQMAFARIRAHERRRRFTLRMISVAACLCVLVGTGAMVLGRNRHSADRVAAPVTELPVLTSESIVYASLNDPCFHVHAGCSRIQGEAVELQVITAMEFEKELCTGCGANVQINLGQK